MKSKCLVVVILLLICVTSTNPMIAKNIEKISQSISNGNWLYVGGNGPGNYTRIQDAINNANDGNIIFVYDDSSPYIENVVVDKPISLIGETKETTIIDGNYKGDVIKIAADNVSISNFKIINCMKDWNFAGIKIISNYNVVFNNDFQNNYRIDIQIVNSSYNIIQNNNIKSNCYYGIVFESQSHNNYIFNNSILNHQNYGIRINTDSNLTTISENFIKNNTFGIDIWGKHTIITNNTISDNWEGIDLHFSQYNNIMNNEFYNNGIIIDISLYNNISNNTVNDKPLIYLQNESHTTINSDAGQIILINCDSIIIENQTLINVDIGLTIRDSNNCQITDNTCSSNHKYGLIITDSSEITISNNNFSLNDESGIVIINTTQVNIINNKIKYNYRGVEIHWESKDILIENNNISFNIGYGLEIRSHNMKIINNDISNNQKGIFLMDGTNIISDNLFNANKEVAIDFDFYELNNFISGNIIRNSKIGISISGDNNTVYFNHFENNVLGIYAVGIIYHYDSKFLNVTNNNFIKNKIQAFFYVYEYNKVMWKSNYWGRVRVFPYIIFGIQAIRKDIGYTRIPWINIDWHPAQEPYDITGMT